jgi:hypothetical protein
MKQICQVKTSRTLFMILCILFCIILLTEFTKNGSAPDAIIFMLVFISIQSGFISLEDAAFNIEFLLPPTEQSFETELVQQKNNLLFY